MAGRYPPDGNPWRYPRRQGHPLGQRRTAYVVGRVTTKIENRTYNLMGALWRQHAVAVRRERECLLHPAARRDPSSLQRLHHFRLERRRRFVTPELCSPPLPMFSVKSGMVVSTNSCDAGDCDNNQGRDRSIAINNPRAPRGACGGLPASLERCDYVECDGVMRATIWCEKKGRGSGRRWQFLGSRTVPPQN